MSLADIARMVDGQLDGPAGMMITSAEPLYHAAPDCITFIDSADKVSQLDDCPAAAAIVPTDVTCAPMAVIRVADVHKAFAAIVVALHPRHRLPMSSAVGQATIPATASIGRDVLIHPAATIGEDVVIGAGSCIHAGACVMAGSRLGRDVTVFPGVVLYEDTVVGDRSIIHATAVIGANGFGYKFTDGRHEATAQLGYVEIGDDCEIGAGTIIDRGTYGPTIIGTGTKIDNQVQIGHNCRIGRHNLLVSQVGIAGSTSTGDYVVMAGQVGVRDHVHIGEGAILGAKSGISNNVEPATRMLGIPATREREQKVRMASVAKLPVLRRQVKSLVKTVAQLQQQLDTVNRRAA